MLGWELFTSADVSYRWEDILAFAELTGNLEPLWNLASVGLACERLAEEKELEISEEELQCEADSLRRDLNLMTSAKTVTWLEQRNLDGEALGYFLERSLWVERLRKNSDEIDGISKQISAMDIIPMLWPEAVLRKQVDALLLLAARRVAVGKVSTEPVRGTSDYQREVELLSFERGLDHRKLDHWRDQTHFLKEQLEMILDLEISFRVHVRSLVTKERLQAELGARQIELKRVEVGEVLFTTESAALEALLCVKEDGESLEEAARQARAPYSRSTPFLGDISEPLSSTLFSAQSGEVFGPMATDNGYRIYQLFGKIDSTPDDQEVISRLSHDIEKRYFDNLIRTHIQWLRWQPRET